ncbi:MAG: hypothetical protein IID35_03705 [Planctomycetes bacterium]|nr:hypothetical protein [Planctomycetota bacterium]
MMDLILKDSHRAFHGALRRLQALDKSDIAKADVTKMLEAFEQNYVPWVFASLEQRRMAAKAKST